MEVEVAEEEESKEVEREEVEEQACRWEAGKHKPSPRSRGCQWHFSPAAQREPVRDN
jgi:hypothetical protein